MRADAVVEQGAAVRLHVDGIGVALQGMSLVAGDEDALALGVEAQQLQDYPRPAGELADEVSVFLVKIEVVVAVALALQYELVGIPGQELYGMQGFYVFGAGLAIEFSESLARCGIVADQPAVVLVAVELEEVECLGIRAPGDVGEVDGRGAVGAVA